MTKDYLVTEVFGPTIQGVRKLPESVIVAPRRRHSEKPEELQDLIERVYPGLRYLELFARRTRPGWTCRGLEIDDVDSLAV